VSLRNERELIASREKLRQLERTVVELKALDPRSRATELSIQSLIKLINQLKVEIAWFESKTTA
jgi:hypothetical protein